jgi:5,10-methylenetetrahydrofolate reductase
LTNFREALLSQDFSISAELSLKRESIAVDVHRQVDALDQLVDGIQVVDNPWSWVQMSAVAAAGLVQQKGVDPIPLLTCRDRNRVALYSDLLGLRAMGVTSVLLTYGKNLQSKIQLKATEVFDTTGIEFVSVASKLNNDPSLGAGEDFFIGTGARVFRPGAEWPAKSLKARVDAGARFVQSQFCFDTDAIRAYADALVSLKLTWKCAVIISLAVLPSANAAIWFKKNMPAINIPMKVVERLNSASDPELEGIKICSELMQEISEIPGVSGVNLMTMGDPGLIPAAIRASGLRS